MATGLKITAREMATQLGLEHKEIIRRIRRGDIKADKWGWNWAIPATEVSRVRESDWYKRYQERHAVAS